MRAEGPPDKCDSPADLHFAGPLPWKKRGNTLSGDSSSGSWA
jgi:hypothetical protein